MTTTGDQPRVLNAGERRRVVAATMIGTTIEWYDFFIYALLANTTFDLLFFSPAGPTGAQIVSLLSIGLPFLIRPFGAVLAGYLGDRFGRRPVLVGTLLMMGVATTLIGVLPTYAQIGVAAPVLLVALRFVQGLSTGGEWGGAALMSTEFAPPGKRGLYSVPTQLGAPMGILLASAVIALSNIVAPGDAFNEWGWRIPFLLSVVLIVVGIVVRSTVGETPVFSEIAEERKQESAPVRTVVSGYGRTIFLACLILAGNTAIGYMVTGGFVQGLASNPPERGGLGYDPVQVQLAVIVGAVVWLITTWAGGYLSDRIGRKRITTIGFVLQILAVIPMFELVKNYGVVGVALACVLVSFAIGFNYGPVAAWYAESFPASVRFSGAAITYALGAILGGAFAALIAKTLVAEFGTTWAVVAYLVVMGLIGLAATRALPERRDIPLDVEFERTGRWDTWTPDEADHTGQPADRR